MARIPRTISTATKNVVNVLNIAGGDNSESPKEKWLISHKIDPSAKVSEWVKGLAKSANQGPLGQAHIVESIFPPVDGGAYKSPEDPPYFTDWCCISGGDFADLVVESIFGAEFTLSGGLRAHPRLEDFDANAKLLDVPCQGKNFTITRNGVL